MNGRSASAPEPHVGATRHRPHDRARDGGTDTDWFITCRAVQIHVDSVITRRTAARRETRSRGETVPPDARGSAARRLTLVLR